MPKSQPAGVVRCTLDSFGGEARERPRLTAGRRIPVADLDVLRDAHWAAIMDCFADDPPYRTQVEWRGRISKLTTVKNVPSSVQNTNRVSIYRNLRIPLALRYSTFVAPLLSKQKNQNWQVVCAGPDPEPRQAKYILFKK